MTPTQGTGTGPDDEREGEYRVEITVASPSGRRRRGERRGLDPDAWSFHPERLTTDPDADGGDDGDGHPVGPGTWFVEAGDLLAEAYCVTLVQGLDLTEAFRRWPVTPAATREVSLDDLVERAYDESAAEDDRQLVGVCELGGWTLVLEPNGFTGTDASRLRRLSEGVTVVTLYSNINFDNELAVTVDREEQLRFDMMFPADRTGARRDDFVADLTAAGFLPPRDGDDGLQWAVAGATLVERLTGVRLTVGLLADLRFRTGLASVA